MEETKEIIDVEYEELLSDMPRDINTITTEILLYKNQAGEAILEIGKRLIEVKAQLDHGEWLDYLKERVDVSVRTAQTMMQLAKEYSSNAQTFALLGSQKALKLLTLPAAEREEFVAQNDVADMSVRQLDEAIKAQKAAEKERDYWENEAKAARQEMEEQLSEQQCVYDTDMAKAQQELHDAAARAENALTVVAELKGKLRELEDKPRSADPKELEAARKAEAERAAYEQTTQIAEQERAALTKQAEELRRRLAMANSDMAVFKVHFESMQDSANKMLECIARAEDSGASEIAGKMRAAARSCCQAVIAGTEV
nr:MAG TPA: Protein of unknown function (DUF3102) [Caudoviricetes sp.]